MLPLPQVAAFADELGKLAGLSAHPALLKGATNRLLKAPVSSMTAPTASGLARISKATSPAAVVPPPNISA